MRLRGITIAVSTALVSLGLSIAAHASSTIDLIWADTGTNQIHDVPSSSEITLLVILTAGPNGSLGGVMSVDYSDAVNALSVIGYGSTLGSALPIGLSPTTDTGSRIENINGGALPPYVGTGLTAGQSHLFGTVTFHAKPDVNGSFEISSDADSPVGALLDLAGNNVTSTSTFNSAFLINDTPCSCDGVIEINALRGGSPTVTVGSTKDITARARIAKGTALPGTTIDAMLQIDAIDGTDVIDSQTAGPIRLVIGKGGSNDKLAMNVNQCNAGFVTFEATFRPVGSACPVCGATRRITKTCN